MLNDADRQILEDLLDEWVERRSRGEDPRPEELCREHPQIYPVFLEKIEKLKAIQVFLVDTGFAETTPPIAKPPADASPLAVKVETHYAGTFHARGGLGEVHKARDESLGRDIAVKVIQGQHANNPELVRRFLWEAEVTSRLDHPGIVPVHTLGRTADGRPCYSMRFIHGDDLAHAIRRFHADPSPRDSSERSLAFRQLLSRFISVCNTIAYAHSRGIIHRDIKPENIMLGKYGETLVVDWGMAKQVGRPENQPVLDEGTLRPLHDSETPVTQPGSAHGTPSYMSPEQAIGNMEAIGPATDVYSLGATLYTILTGRPPFREKALPEYQQKIQRGRFPRPREVRKDVPRALEAICLKAMALEPPDRYATAADIAGEIEKWLGDEAVKAWREPWIVKVKRWGRKHRTAAATAVSVLLTATIGLATALFFVNAEKSRTELARQGEETQRVAAEKNDEVSKAALDFIEKRILDPAKPKGEDGGMGYDVRLADAIKAALLHVKEHFNGKPLIEARIRRQLGITMMNLGDPRTAAQQFEEALAIYRHLNGPNDPCTLETMYALAQSQDAQGETKRAMKLLCELWDLSISTYGLGHERSFHYADRLASMIAEIGHSEDARELYELMLPVMKAHLGRDSDITLSTMTNLATIYAVIGKKDDCLKLYQETLELASARLGPKHPNTLRCRGNLANGYVQLGRHHDALELRKVILTMTQETFGPDHPDTLSAGVNLAGSYTHFGQHKDAVQLYENALPVMKAKLLDHQHTSNCMIGLADSYSALGQHAEALKLLEELLQLAKKRRRSEHEVLMAMDRLFAEHKRIGNHDDAEKFLREVIAIREKLAQSTDSLKAKAAHLDSLARNHGSLAELLESQKRLSEADAYFRQAFAICQKLVVEFPHDNGYERQLAAKYRQVARLCSARGLQGEALSFREEGLGFQKAILARRKARLGPDHADTLVSMFDLGRTYASLGRTAEAVSIYEEALSVMKAKAPDNPLTFRCMANLAMTHADLGRRTDAMRLREETLELRRARLGSGHTDTVWSMYVLARSHADCGQPAEALKLHKETLDLRKAKLGPDDPDTLWSLLRVYQGEKDAVGCLDTAKKFEARPRTNGESMVDAAHMRAVCAAVIKEDSKIPAAERNQLAKEQVDGSIAWLKQAVEAGYMNADHLEYDTDGNVWRDQEDFKNLLAKLKVMRSCGRAFDVLCSQLAWPLLWSWPLRIGP